MLLNCLVVRRRLHCPSEMSDYPRESGKVALRVDGDPRPAIASMTALVDELPTGWWSVVPPGAVIAV
jgi:hypothetical protein